MSEKLESETPVAAATNCSRLPFDEECVWHFALRYALPRTSTASTIVSEFLRTNLSRIDPRTLRQMANEIDEAIQRGHAGHAMDVTIWRRLADDIHSANDQIHGPRP